MLKGMSINPEIMRVLPRLGHGDKILIADGNYPLDSKSGSAAKLWLGLCPGIPTVTDVLKTLMSAINIEHAAVMMPEGGAVPEIFHEFEGLFDGMDMEKLSRSAFYEECGKESLRLAISTGEKRVFSNILITVGVV